MNHLTYDVDGQKNLRDKQFILDFWWAFERYHFRTYYAATGIHYKSIYTDRWIENQRSMIRYQAELTQTKPSGAEQLFDRARNELREFYDREVPAHKERWGEWFFMNIQRAFNEEYGEPSDKDVASQKAHGAARLATEAEAVAVATGAGHQSPVHDQEF